MRFKLGILTCTIVVGLTNGSPAQAELPFVCQESHKSTLEPEIKVLRKKTSAKLLKEIEKSEKNDLIDLHQSYGTWIRNLWFRGRHKHKKLIAYYEANGLTNPDDMSMDLIEGVWVIGDSKRCEEFKSP